MQQGFGFSTVGSKEETADNGNEAPDSERDLVDDEVSNVSSQLQCTVKCTQFTLLHELFTTRVFRDFEVSIFHNT